MDSIDFSKLTAKELYSEEVICKIMDEPDPLIREQLGFDLIDRAAEFGSEIKKRVERMLKLAEKDMTSRENERKKSEKQKNFERTTDFGKAYPEMRCGNWIANMDGIYNPDAMPDNRIACPHPILPAEVITNVEDGMQKVRLAFYRQGRWREQIVSKSIIAQRSKIPELAVFGIAVTSETAKSLVKYLAEVEQLNIETIPEVRATAKMGWCEDGFMPYTSELAFDKDGRFDTLFDTITTAGSRKKWMDFILSVRASGRVEPRLAMAASLASVLIKPCGLLPFWVDIWGRTGGGKSVCGMVAASVWADPEIGKFISNFDDTISAFEAKAGFFNNLPFIIDDTARVRKNFKDDFSQLIYQLASGEGRGRSNTKLGLAPKNTWANVIICSGETPIITDQLQGGAVNRVLEYETDDGDIFPDGQAAATLLRNNYGFIGREFVDVLCKLGMDEVMRTQQDCFKAIRNEEYEDKQLRSLSAILTADLIATEYIFKDGKRLSFDELKKALTDKHTLSENERCYAYIISECDVNNAKFVGMNFDEYRGEVWGIYHTDKTTGKQCLAIHTNVFKRICAEGGFNAKAFISWALKNGILIGDSNGNPTKTINFGACSRSRCYVLVRPNEPEEEEK
ncbi:MAG: DUF927 domain-containing protein [Acutalibacteraceae bacterium]